MKHLFINAERGYLADVWAEVTLRHEVKKLLSFGQIVRLLKALMDDPNMNKELVKNLVQTFIEENKEGCEEEGDGEEGE